LQATGDDIDVFVTGKNKPVVVKPVGAGGTYVIMPMVDK
jgi:hypothetical protein